MIKNKEIVFVDNELIQNIFADIIEVSVNNETATLKIGLKDKNNETARASHNIIITTPHFLRLADAMKTTSENILKQIETHSNNDTNI